MTDTWVVVVALVVAVVLWVALVRRGCRVSRELDAHMWSVLADKDFREWSAESEREESEGGEEK